MTEGSGAAEIEERLYQFRGGPLDGRRLLVPVSPNREWSIPTVEGVWLGDLSEPLPEDLSTIDYRHEHYLRVDDQYVHATLVTSEDDPPPHWKLGSA